MRPGRGTDADDDVVVRAAEHADVRALHELDLASRTTTSSPAPARADQPDRYRDDLPDVLVAEWGGRVVGMAQLGRPSALVSNRHVWSLHGLDVEPASRHRGIGRRLLDAAMDEAVRRGATRLTLRVLAPNAAARSLYTSAGFVVEGVLVGEFVLDGESVDDVLMARSLEGRAGPTRR